MSDETFSLIGIYGGTFDPVHFGHLRVAEELIEILQLDEIRFLPAGYPRLRNEPIASQHHRKTMLYEAIRDNKKFFLDDRELRRSGESYSVESLRELRDEFKGKKAAFCFIIGVDAFLKLPNWHLWRELFELSHLVIVNRPGHISFVNHACLPPKLQDACLDRWTDDVNALKRVSSGFVFTAVTTLLDISSTTIRAYIAAEKSARYLLPDNVLNYIGTHHVYTRKNENR
ncbi:nicotinate-nucleotide adenylyltransferase [Nitrosomonas communis]|uniref:Probable nicotinate-nucleotide adenylyltransferase n=1 Tax=Nitrosomonas communis TaxID=44574 RepID=A0A1I4LDE1_9PROT|nr:nicotinate-nucleotide adenylyltransferase [Nitrosomonas communis]SFL88951.1 nicotinate-nucleotide adenylyltransferase [Nitrosomonas communis]